MIIAFFGYICIQISKPTAVNYGETSKSIFRRIDIPILVTYLLLVIAGAVSIFAASYHFDNASMFDFSQFSGKQFCWIGLSMVLGVMILLVDDWFFDTYAYPIYAALLLLLAVTIVIAPDIKGSHSWIVLGPVSLQPAEFAKFATALALAKLFSSYNFSLNASLGNYLKAIAIIFAPIVLILAQKETGSALVFTSLVFVLYREGMSGLILFAGLVAVVVFVVSLKYSAFMLMGIPGGEFLVLALILVLIIGMIIVYCKSALITRNLLIIYLSAAALFTLLYFTGLVQNGRVMLLTTIVVTVCYLLWEMLKKEAKKILLIIGFALSSIVFLYSVNYVFTDVLQEHQQMRIKVVLGIEEDLRGVGYNVNQSKIAIGSGGLVGKGFLNGTQTKLKYVPEQHTDFIFCTIGEEEGFVGSVAVILAFLFLILRIIKIAERQRTAFGRVYCYCVASYFIFHIGINIGMVMDLCPVIGIPLPFFSYGGSSLWGFTILIFILLKIDACRDRQ